MKLRRDIILFAALALVAVAGAGFLLSSRPGAAVDAFVRDTRSKAARAQIAPANAEAFRATVCAETPCVLVEAGGLAFVFGSGEGAAEGLGVLGLMRSDLDGIVLPDLTLQTLAGLPEMALTSRTRGRTQALTVYGPPGIVPVVDGANLMLSADPGVRLVVGAEGEDQGIEGLVVFDSGVVAIRAFGGHERGQPRVYRVDFEGKSLVLASCRAQVDQIVAAARGTRMVAGVIAAASREMSAGNRSACLSIEDALAASDQAKLAGVLLAPVEPSLAIPGALAAWREILAHHKTSATVADGMGSALDLSGERPAIRRAGL